MKLATHSFRIGAALALPLSLAAATVALAAWLFASDLRPVRHTPRTGAQVIVIDDLPAPQQATARAPVDGDRG
jgi:hypothetical protein